MVMRFVYSGPAFNCTVIFLVLLLTQIPFTLFSPMSTHTDTKVLICTRYIPSLKGVVLLHSNLQFQQPNATIQGDCPFATCHITFDAMVWSPTVGMQLSESSLVTFTFLRLHRHRISYLIYSQTVCSRKFESLLTGSHLPARAPYLQRIYTKTPHPTRPVAFRVRARGKRSPILE